jgi:hypothetical protein
MPQVPAISPDIIIIASAILIALYGLFMGHAKVKTLALSSYVGLVLAQEFAENAHHLVSSVSMGTVRLVLFLAPVILLEISKRHHEPGGRSGIFITLVLSVLTSALLISGVLSQLDEGTRMNIIENSSLALEITKLHLVWLAAVPVLAVVESFIGGMRKEQHH